MSDQKLVRKITFNRNEYHAASIGYLDYQKQVAERISQILDGSNSEGIPAFQDTDRK